MIKDIPIEIIELEDNSYHLMIEAVFSNNTSRYLIIDTGASKTVFDEVFISEFIIDIETVDDNKSSGINSMITEIKTGVLPHFSLGNAYIKNYEIITMDLSHINEIYKSYSDRFIAGLIGSDFLKRYEAIIDYGQSKLTLNTI